MTRKAIALVMVSAVVAGVAAWADGAEEKASAAPGVKTQKIERRIVISPSRGVLAPRAGAWMGIRMGPVPEALAAHLRLGETGVIVRNVVVASPADKARLAQYDVIVKLDGKDVRGMAALAGNVGG